MREDVMLNTQYSILDTQSQTPQTSNLNPHLAFITVGDPTRLTGGYLYHARLFRGLRDRGIAVDEIVACGAGLNDQLAAAGSFGERFDPRSYDVVVIDALARGVCGPWIDAWRTMRPVVVLVHELPSVANNIAADRDREAPLLRADRLIAVSEHGRDILLDRGVEADRIAIVSPGYDRLEIEPRTENQEPIDPTAYTVLSSQFLVLSVAQWIPRKGIVTLVDAWNRLTRSDAVLHLIGESDADAAYAAEVRAAIGRGKRNGIVVGGKVDDDALIAAYCSADLFVLPSRYEGYGMVYAEALSYGLPVVACAIEPVRTVVSDAAGLFVPLDNPSALANAIARLLDDAALRARLKRGAIERARQLPTWDNTVAAFEVVLYGVLGRDRGQCCRG